MRAPAGIRILVWMCVLIAVNQLGFGSIIPALALYARSFDVTQSAIGLASRSTGSPASWSRCPPATSRTGSGAATRSRSAAFSPTAGNVLCALAPTYPAFVGARSWPARAPPSCSPPA